MHKLDRTAVAAPPCLAEYDPDRDEWEAADKKQIQAHLEQMQGRRCAYCECSLDYFGHHIEHFRRKNKDHFPALKFVWSNLFWSCQEKDHCGHYKDRPRAAAYDPAELIKPDDDEPDKYLYFHSSGDVRPRPKLTPKEQRKAEETIRVFNLDCGTLQAARRRALDAYQRRDSHYLDELMAADEATRKELISYEVLATSGDPHCTVIRHFFEKAG